MEIIYEGGAIVDAKLEVPLLQSRMTKPERLAIFGCSLPDTTLLAHIDNLELGKVDEHGVPLSTVQDAVNRMVTIGAITQGRADEILA